MHGVHPRAVFPAFPHDRGGDGLGLALVLPAGADRRDQRRPVRASAFRSSPSCAPPRRRCRPCWRRRSGRGSGSRSSSSWPACGRSRSPITRPRASTACRKWAILRRITLPLLKPTLVFLVVFSSIGFLRIFDQVYNMTTNDPGGPLNATKPLVLMIYQTAFSSFEMGYAAAQTVVLFVILLVDLPRPAAHHERPLMKRSRILPGPSRCRASGPAGSSPGRSCSSAASSW